MEAIMWVLILAYTFGIGYAATVTLSDFIRHNPRAFPENRKIIVMPPSSWQNCIEGDRSCNPWYNDCTYFEELENHEECNS